MIKPIQHPGRILHHKLIDEVKWCHFSYDLIGGDIIDGVRTLIIWAPK